MLIHTAFGYFAESEGFEPPDPCRSTVFKTAAIDRSANSPLQKYIFLQFSKLFPAFWLNIRAFSCVWLMLSLPLFNSLVVFKSFPKLNVLMLRTLQQVNCSKYEISFDHAGLPDEHVG